MSQSLLLHPLASAAVIVELTFNSPVTAPTNSTTLILKDPATETHHFAELLEGRYLQVGERHLIGRPRSLVLMTS